MVVDVRDKRWGGFDWVSGTVGYQGQEIGLLKGNVLRDLRRDWQEAGEAGDL
jgi:hypothetical protein